MLRPIKLIQFVLILLSVYLSGCATSLHVISITPSANSATSNKMPYSVSVEFEELNDTYGAPIPFARLDTENVKRSFSEFILKRGTFRKIRMIPGGLSDFYLKTSLNLTYVNKISNPDLIEYTATTDAHLFNQAGELVGVYKLSAVTRVNATFADHLKLSKDALLKKKWTDPVNEVVNSVFNNVCQQIETDYTQGKISPSPLAAVSPVRWAHVENILLNAFENSDIPFQVEAVEDLIVGMRRGHFKISMAELWNKTVSKSRWVQLAAVEILYNSRDSKALLDIAMASNNLDVLNTAVVDLLAIDKDYTVASLETIFKVGSDPARKRSAFVLGEIGLHTKEVIPLLFDLLPSTKLHIIKTAYTNVDISADTQPRDFAEIFEMIKEPGYDQKVIEEKVRNSREKRWPGLSETEVSAVFGTFLDQMVEKLIAAHEKRSKRERIKKEREKKLTDELTAAYKYVEIIKSSSDTSGADEETLIETTIHCNINVAAYALNRITGEDFGTDVDKWKKWWKENETIFQ